jgi:hypothetical protein
VAEPTSPLGLSNDEIAAQLSNSPTTAKTHVSRAMTKLGARGRARMVVLAYESGLAGPRSPTADSCVLVEDINAVTMLLGKLALPPHRDRPWACSKTDRRARRCSPGGSPVSCSPR